MMGITHCREQSRPSPRPGTRVRPPGGGRWRLSSVLRQPLGEWPIRVELGIGEPGRGRRLGAQQVVQGAPLLLEQFALHELVVQAPQLAYRNHAVERPELLLHALGHGDRLVPDLSFGSHAINVDTIEGKLPCPASIR